MHSLACTLTPLAAIVFLMSDVSANLLVDTLHWDKVIMHDALGTYLADEQLFYDDKDQISEVSPARALARFLHAQRICSPRAPKNARTRARP